MICLNDVSVHAGSFHLDGVNLLIPSGEYGVLMGKTGAGKTSILEAIIGFKSVTAGTIRVAGRDVTHENPALRGIGYVPQDGALFSTMTVEENLAFALRVRKVDNKRIASRVKDVAELMGIGRLLSRRPHGLSGGERQRVALGRALAFEPSILCLDEPLSALDSEMREQILEFLMTIKRMKGVTTIHVTHDLAEAARLADKLFRLVDGKVAIVELTSATEIHSHAEVQPSVGPCSI